MPRASRAINTVLFTLRVRDDILTTALTCDVTGETLVSLFEGAAIVAVTGRGGQGGSR